MTLMTPHADDDHDEFGGLARDLPGLLSRRSMFALVVGGSLVALAACGSDDDTGSATGSTTGSSSTASTASSATTPGTTGEPASTSAAATAATTSDAAVTTDSGDSAACETIPGETAGPFPGDGSNGPDVLSESGVVRSDITSSIGSASGVAEGVPLAITIDLVDTANGCAAFAGAAVYVWHCDRDGLYSMYSQGATDQNYLRGVQEADANGQVTFASIFPAAYSGRWPHIHFEVYPSVDAATTAQGLLATSQIALPEETCNLVYATEGYEQSVRNMTQTSLTSDNVFGDDGGVRQIATVAGDPTSGLSIQLTVPV
jgi:protocatechuate 3,4-dioxygenase beta subunit